MAIPPSASDANAASTAEKTVLTDAANAHFIDMATQAINNAIGLGQSSVYLSTFQHCDIKYLMNYFNNLKYYVTFPDFSLVNGGGQPGELFGAAWIAYWENQIPFFAGHPLHNPVRMGISWTPPRVIAFEPV